MAGGAPFGASLRLVVFATESPADLAEEVVSSENGRRPIADRQFNSSLFFEQRNRTSRNRASKARYGARFWSWTRTPRVCARPPFTTFESSSTTRAGSA